MERVDNTLVANQLRNDRDTISPETAFIEGGTTQDERPVAQPTSRTMTRRKLSIFVSIAVAVIVIILVVLIPILGVRKNA